jgi:hypothetical protein
MDSVRQGLWAEQRVGLALGGCWFTECSSHAITNGSAIRKVKIAMMSSTPSSVSVPPVTPLRP